MTGYDEIASKLPLEQLAAQVGAEPAEVQQAVHAILPALLGGLQANAAHPGGAASLTNALSQHTTDLTGTGTVDLSQVDPADGAKITQHVFGAQTDQVINQLGGVGGGSGLVSKLMPLLAPIVMSYVAKQLPGGGAAAGTANAAGGGVLSGILSQILSGSAAGSTSGSSSGGLGGVLGGVLGGLLGGGTKI